MFYAMEKYIYSESLFITLYIDIKQKHLKKFFGTKYPAGKYWSLGRTEDVPLQRPLNVPQRSYLTVPGTSRTDVPGTSQSDVLGTS